MVDASDTYGDPLTGLLNHLDAARRARPPWWRDAEQHDRLAEQRDAEALRRDDAADARDTAARHRDTDALARERVAVEVTTQAYERMKRQDEVDAAQQLAHVESAAGVARLFAELQALPDDPSTMLQEVHATVELHLEQAYAALLTLSEERAVARTELRDIAQHLDATVRDRLATGVERSASHADRNASRTDREHALAARQRAAVDRAAGS